MKRKVFTKKLKSSKGASILLGLAFFLMCFFVASVIMAAASVNASRALAQREEQRSFFAIQSTQNLIKDMFAEINGKNSADNLTPLFLGQDEDDFGTMVDVNADTRGGFHLREEEIKYDWCNEGRTYYVYGQLTGNVNGAGNDAEYSKSEFGLDYKGDPDAVFMKDAIEEVAMMAMCKRLYDQGVSADSLLGYGELSSCFAEIDRDFNMSNNPDYTYYFDITPAEGSGIYSTNIPTVHVKMTADNKANLFFELTVDSRYASTYSATMKVKATIEAFTPGNAFLDNTPWKARCDERSTPEKNEYHLVTRTVNDTYITWYTKDIEITKGIKLKDAE